MRASATLEFVRCRRVVPIGVGTVLLLTFAAFGPTAGTPDRSVRDGVYSAAQAVRGRAIYDDKCAACHDGGTMGPALTGSDFLAPYADKTVRVLYDRVKNTMPADSPGTLSESEGLDVVSYVLRMNGFPAGDKPLEAASNLDAIKFGR